MKTSGASRREKVDLRLEFRDVIPGRCEASNYDVQLHIGESRDSGSGASAPSRNDSALLGCLTIESGKQRHHACGLTSDVAAMARERK